MGAANFPVIKNDYEELLNAAPSRMRAKVEEKEEKEKKEKNEQKEKKGDAQAAAVDAASMDPEAAVIHKKKRWVIEEVREKGEVT